MPSQSMSMSAFQKKAVPDLQMLTVALPASSSVLYLPFEATEQVLVFASSCAAVGGAFGVAFGVVAAWADAAIRGSDTTPRVTRARRSRRMGGPPGTAEQLLNDLPIAGCRIIY